MGTLLELTEAVIRGWVDVALQGAGFLSTFGLLLGVVLPVWGPRRICTALRYVPPEIPPFVIY